MSACSSDFLIHRALEYIDPTEGNFLSRDGADHGYTVWLLA